MENCIQLHFILIGYFPLKHEEYMAKDGKRTRLLSCHSFRHILYGYPITSALQTLPNRFGYRC